MGAVHQISATAIDATFPADGRGEPAALMLDEKGIIYDCSKAGENLFGYRRSELVWQPVSRLLPQLAEMKLIHNEQFNSRLGYLCRCGHLFQVHSRHGDVFYSALHFVHLHCNGKRMIRLVLRGSGNAGAYSSIPAASPAS
jgi:PAS domain S-box-containing protein